MRKELRSPLLRTASQRAVVHDYKGEFLLGNHKYCYLLTVTDHARRFLLTCGAPDACIPSFWKRGTLVRAEWLWTNLWTN